VDNDDADDKDADDKDDDDEYEDDDGDKREAGVDDKDADDMEVVAEDSAKSLAKCLSSLRCINKGFRDSNDALQRRH
jgi:hypothetical protein